MNGKPQNSSCVLRVNEYIVNRFRTMPMMVFGIGGGGGRRPIFNTIVGSDGEGSSVLFKRLRTLPGIISLFEGHNHACK